MGKHTPVESYLDALPPELGGVARQLCDVVRTAVPDAGEAVKWSHPTWSDQGPFCYVKAFAKHVNLGFWRSASLPDPHGVIVSTGEKMGHVRFAPNASIDPEVLTPLILAARQLNRTLGDPSRTR